MTLPILQLSNLGVKIVVNVKDPAGAARDLTGASQLKIKLRSVLSPTGKTVTATAENLAAGSLSYVLALGDLDTLGTWQVQAYYELGNWKGHTEAVDAFYVEGNLA